MVILTPLAKHIGVALRSRQWFNPSWNHSRIVGTGVCVERKATRAGWISMKPLMPVLMPQAQVRVVTIQLTRKWEKSIMNCRNPHRGPWGHVCARLRQAMIVSVSSGHGLPDARTHRIISRCVYGERERDRANKRHELKRSLCDDRYAIEFEDNRG